MKNNLPFLPIVTLIFGLLSSQLAYSATLRPPKSLGETNCSLVLEGAISEGDAEALQSVLPYAERGEFTLCLDSPGGSLNEGIRMSDIVAEHGVATLVTNGAVCASACALTFLGGRCSVTGSADIYERHCRFIEPEAVVGFHAPFIQELEQATLETFSAAEVRRIWATSRVASGLYAEALSNRAVPMDMIVDFLAVEPNDLYVVDTVESARRLNIIVLDLPPGQLSPNVIIGICADVLPDSVWAAKSYAQGNEDFQIEILKRDERQIIIASQLTFLNFPYATWTACRIAFDPYGSGIFPPYARAQGSLSIVKCDRIMLEIPESLKTPIPRYSWKGNGEIEALGHLFGEEPCVSVHEYFGLEAEMWVRDGSSRIDVIR